MKVRDWAEESSMSSMAFRNMLSGANIASNAAKSNLLAGLQIRDNHRPQLMPYHYRNRMLEQIVFEGCYEL